MSRVKPIIYIESLSGKACMHSDVSFFKRGRKTFTRTLCYSRTSPASALELANRARFKLASQRTSAIMREAEQRSNYVTTWNKRKYYTLRDWVFHCVYLEIVSENNG